MRALGRARAGRAVLGGVGSITGAAIGIALGGARAGAGVGDIADRWLQVLDALGCRYEVGKHERGRVEVRMLACPAGLSPREGRQTCLAGMAADRALLTRLGGHLEIGETIASGAACCRLAVRAARAEGTP